MIVDYLIVAYLTIISNWYISLPVMGIAIWWLFRKKRYVAGSCLGLLFILITIAAIDFEHYIN